MIEGVGHLGAMGLSRGCRLRRASQANERQASITDREALAVLRS